MTTSNDNKTERTLGKDTMVHPEPLQTPSWNKEALRAELASDVERWLAQGNEITKEPDAENDRNGRRVEVHGGGYYF